MVQGRGSVFSRLSGCVSGQDIAGRGPWQVVLAKRCFLTSCPLRPVHPEDGTEHAQEQGHLQEYEEQEVDTAEQGPWVSAGRSRRPCRDLAAGGWENKHLNLEKGFRQEARKPLFQQQRGNPTPVLSCIVCSEVLQGHCEGEVARMVQDGHSASPRLSPEGAGRHSLGEKWQARLSAPVFVKGLIVLLVPALHAQGSAHGARHVTGAAQRPGA